MIDYDFWQRALAGEEIGGPTLPIHDGEAQVGFWRKRASKAGAYLPVAIWRTEEDGLICLVSNDPADPADVWSYCCRHPITEAQYRSRVETGKWWDEDDSVTASLAHDLNNQPDELAALTDQIEAALAAVDTYKEVKDDATAAKAQSARSRLLELSREADKKRELEKKPHFEAGKAVDTAWQPLVKSAKEGADSIAKALSAHETAKAKEAARLQAIADAARVEAERLRALNASPVSGPNAVLDVVLPPPPPVAAPAPIKGAYGRAAAVKTIKIATVVDQDATYAYLKAQPEVVEVIQKIAQKMVTNGMTVPGVTVTEEKKVV